VPNFTAGTSFTDGVTNDVTAAKLNALVADAVPTSSLALASTTGTISNFTTSTATVSGPITASTAVINVGSGQIYKDASGLVGIGTTSPDALLDVKRVNTDGLIAEFGSGDLAGDVVLEIKSSDSRAAINIGANGGTGDASRNLAFSTNGTERLRIDSSGNVGVGTVSPASVLDISKASDTSERAIRVQNSSCDLYVGVEGTSANRFSGSSANNAFLGTTGADGIEFATNNTVRTIIDSSGNVGVGTNNPSTPSGKCITIYDSNTPRLNLKNSTSGDTSTDGVELYLTGSDASLNNRENGSINIGTNNSTRLFIDSSGNVSIGTATALSKLHVHGDLTMSNATTAVTASTSTITPPATVAGYLTVSINGTSRKIPYYAT